MAALADPAVSIQRTTGPRSGRPALPATEPTGQPANAVQS